MRIAIAIFMMLHGVAHLPGFVVPWRIATFKETPYKTTLLSSRLDVGDIGIRIIGLLWLAIGGAFVMTGIAIITDLPWWGLALACVSCASLILGALSMPEARIGVMINLAILAVMAFSRMAEWLNIHLSRGTP